MQVLLNVAMDGGMRDLDFYVDGNLATWEKNGATPSQEIRAAENGKASSHRCRSGPARGQAAVS